MTLLIMAACDTTVNKADVCNACTQFKSQGDCQSYPGCSWTAASGTTAGSCAKTVPPTAYCPGLTNPGTTCASTYGCAYLDCKCTNFTGCSAYVKTTTSDCQAISNYCISDGTVCTDALECSKYSATQCTQNPDLNTRKCTLDSTSNNCRNYNCSEADATYTTDKACSGFAAGCVTTGAGCVASPLPACSSLTGTESTCPLMTGSDGPCKFNTGTTNCAAKVCTDALTSTTTDGDCGKFLKGCITTGKGCIATLGACSSYTVTNAATDYTGYTGTDGVCEGDAGATTCRSRKCENGTGTTDALCGTYKTGCVSNGKACVTTKGACSSYSGTTTTCAGYIGSDGNCKGTDIFRRTEFNVQQNFQNSLWLFNQGDQFSKNLVESAMNSKSQYESGSKFEIRLLQGFKFKEQDYLISTNILYLPSNQEMLNYKIFNIKNQFSSPTLHKLVYYQEFFK